MLRSARSQNKKRLGMFICKVTSDANAAAAVAMNKEFIYSDGKLEMKRRKSL